ncbi:hypothetical protein [Acinetobacter rudis]|uniref:Alpha/beta hydrolase n=1 Tax=Acinetobacter rudis CIP 110305 TaxID=421052 RepID=S3NUA9_9GAMM|nr:hypothetical protein [Acinetobacter rudis]EPF70236.1 hypothetical protein F945_03255 [Acinetobacter rudis CIP 110305]
MEKQIIFEDDHIRAIHLPGTSATLVISFGDLITRAKGLSINAEKSLQKYNYAVIGIMPKQKSWFPASSMQALMQHLRPLLDQYQRVVAYGGSMGAYAAIKYSNVLGLQRVVAMVPQYSINPDEVDDRRYTDFFDPALHSGMRIEKQDTRAECEYIVIYDPYYAEDSENFNKIQEVLPQLHSLKLPYTGHDVIAVLANSALLHDFIERDYDETYFYQQMRAVKKNSKFYYRSVIARLLGTHNAALAKILKSRDLQLDGQFFDNQLKQQITRILLTNKRVDEQDLLKLGIQVNLPFEQASQLVDSTGNILVFNMITQKIEAYAREVVDINGKYIIALYVKNHGLAQVEINKEHYLICMNDRRVTKLFKRSDALSLDMNPIVVKKCEDFYVLSYKNLYLSSDADGNCSFQSESVQTTEKFQVN